VTWIDGSRRKENID